MKKIKVMIALMAVFAMMIGTAVYAAPSPVAGTVTVQIPGKPGTSSATITTPTQKEIKALAEYIAQNAASMGMTAEVKGTIKIVAPADYKGGDIPTVFAVAGLPNGASNVFAYILTPNGKKIMVPCTVRNGYVGFVAPSFGTVSIVVLNQAAQTAANANNATLFGSAPTKLH
ncbi:MAG: hypothetical protein J5367_07190 [Lachnospiraceae bacterium]|nr:hypothetical protein [Lachnospiraceae bacterium]